ncbi:hypothetical protein Enr10x_22200 [Gimesia panareensis]|uniref:Uncharacterized protein n=1 Tax=Gimesia panareensis TaxID=2527978 RepID=A0A517Q5N2_9PLAN|nr:hypothetical protein [Gimesia panareensis]QDT26908.1 hypothetical protein Enr10x_22200 [Gimesia panareensis]
MAASGWVSYCPYGVDVEQALGELRQAVFERREYSVPGDLLAGTDEATLNQIAPPTKDLKKLLKISQALDQAFGSMGFDTQDAEQQTRDVEKMIQKIDKEGFAAAAREALGKQSASPPQTIDELLEQCAEAGTHSLLDIDHLSPTPEPGAATPLSEEDLQTLFGTTTPTKSQVEAVVAEGKLHERCARWQAVYFAVYEEGEPVELVFVGVSGD